VLVARDRGPRVVRPASPEPFKPRARRFARRIDSERTSVGTRER